MFLRSCPTRRGATAVEFAVIASFFFLLAIGLIIGGLGVFRYAEVAALAREAARYASVRGIEYQRATRNPPATPESIYRDVILAKAVALDPSRLKCSVTWNKSNAPKYEAPDGTVTTNIVTVTVTYQWVPEAYLGGITLTSTSKMPMSY